MSQRANGLQFVTIAGLVIALDQTTKWLATSRGIIVLNSGGAWSLGFGHAGLILWISIAVLAGIIWWWPKSLPEDHGYLVFILAAGFSNVADRLTFGGVRDFLVLPWFTFNVADLMLTVAAAWLLIEILRRPPR